jgi:hypothetical protein
MEGEKPRLSGDLAVAKVRKRLLDIKKVEFLGNFYKLNLEREGIACECI